MEEGTLVRGRGRKGGGRREGGREGREGREGSLPHLEFPVVELPSW